jgi:hypothetical protein
MIKLIAILTLSISTTLTFGFSPQEIKDSGLDPNNPNHLALYAFLYEIGLKNKMSPVGDKFLPEGTCINFEREKEDTKDNVINKKNSFKLVIGMKDASFKSGSHKLDTNQSKFKKMSQLIDMTNNFFKQAKKLDGSKSNFKPMLEIQGYADPRHNSSNKALSSQENNYQLAKLRTNEIKNTFFKNYASKEKQYISKELDVLLTQPKSEKVREKYNCDKRRGIVLKFDVDPSVSFHSTPGSYSLGFKTLKGLELKKTILSAVMDATDTESLKSLPKECQRNGIKTFHNQASKIGKYLKKYVEKNSTKLKIITDKIIERCKTNTDATICNLKSLNDIKKSNLATTEGIYKLSSYLLEVNGKKNVLKSILSSNETNIINTAMDVTTIATLDKTKRREWENVINKINNNQEPKNKLRPWKFYLGHKFGSYYMSCFSNELYMKNNFSSHTRNLSDLRNKETGLVKFNFSSNNIPTTKKITGTYATSQGQKKELKGWVCQACGTGPVYNKKTGRLDHRNMRSLKHDHSGDSRLVTIENKKRILPAQEETEIIQKNISKEGMLLGKRKIAENMSPSILIVKDCDPKNISTARRIRMDQFDKNGEINIEVKIGENDCEYNPPILSSCHAVPSGDANNSENPVGQRASIYSLLAGKALDINLKKGIESFTEKLSIDLIRKCGSDEIIDPKNHKKIVEDISCFKGGKSILPTESNNGELDCPDVKKLIDSLPDSMKISNNKNGLGQ